MITPINAQGGHSSSTWRVSLATDCRLSALWHRQISAVSADARRHMRSTQGQKSTAQQKSAAQQRRHITNLPIVSKKYSKLARTRNIWLGQEIDYLQSLSFVDGLDHRGALVRPFRRVRAKYLQ
jgi:hypothetical protein